MKIANRILSCPGKILTFREMEILAMKFEIDTPRCQEYKKIGTVPPDALLAWFDDFCYGVFWHRDKSAYYGGLVPKFLYQLDHKSKPLIRDGGIAYVGINPISSIAEATARFLVMVDEYKKKYGFTVLQPFEW